MRAQAQSDKKSSVSKGRRKSRWALGNMAQEDCRAESGKSWKTADKYI